MTIKFDPRLRNNFQNLFQDDPKIIITAPGRINLIGEHTDYSGGFVLPAAINFHVTLMISKNDQPLVDIYSQEFNEQFQLEIGSYEKETSSWKEYIKGIAWALHKKGYPVKGWKGVMTGNIPIGAGLSSSAAIEIAILSAFCHAGNFVLSPVEMAKITQFSEINWVGVNVGVMDQLVSAAGLADHAVLLDCQTMKYEHIPIPKDISFVVLDTNTRRNLTNSAYNTRHDEVNAAAKKLGVNSLREANMALVEKNLLDMDHALGKRARHVIRENIRVNQFVHAMQNGDLREMGKLINASHTSLRDDFEVSSPELNLIVDNAQAHADCLGARMTGAGFGGCALAVYHGKEVEKFCEQIANSYLNITGITPNVLPVTIEDGVKAECI
jgi:galactokinase